MEDNATASDSLTLDIKDEVFTKILKKRREESEKWFDSELDLSKRVKRNKKYSIGKQVDIEKLKVYEGKWLDNVIWESERQIKAMAFSKMPDIIVKPGKEDDESKKTAEGISKVIDNDIKRRERREVVQMAFSHEPIYLRGVIKWRWNPELGKNGDYDFEWVLPEDIVVDHTAKTNDQRDMDFIAQKLHPSLKELIMRFPDKKDDIIKEALNDSVNTDDNGEVPEKGLATKVKKVWETWFTWYEKKGDEYERIEGVVWTYRDLVLKKMKDPNWDWNGEKRLFSYKQELKEEDFRDSMLSSEEIEGYREESVFRNYFENPEKPFIFLNTELTGESPINATSRLEQLILMQYNIDERGKIIVEKLKNRTKNVFSKDSGLKAEDIEDMDLNDPDVDILVDGKVREVHTIIPPDLPTAPEFKDYDDTRSRMFAKAGTFATRGEIQSDTATSNQIGREADFTLADDLVDKTVNYAAERMARASLQLIKLRYNEDHFRRVLGEEGNEVFQKVNRDMVEDGMEVSVTASGTDKLKAERRAMDMAKMKLIDPHTFFEDTGASNPEERTLKLMMFLNPESVAEYTAKYGMGLKDSQAMGNKLNGEDGQQALLDIQQLQQGQQPNPPQQPTPEYLDAFNQFMQSQEFLALPPEVQQMVTEFVQQLLAKAQGAEINAPAEQFGQEGSAPPQQPSAQDTSAIPTEAPVVAQGSTRTL